LAETTSVADQAVLPPPEQIARVERFTQERFVHEGEELATALAAGSARRHAFEAALAELDAGAKVPSTGWRRRFSLLLGLERLLSEDEPHLADGTLLNPHQVDALSGTLTALLADAQRNGDIPAPAATPVLAVDDDDDDDDVDVDDEEAEEEDEDEEEEQEEDEDKDEDEDAEVVDEAPDDPNAHKRFWFEHATGAGKTVAAMGFVEASRTGGVLILTHRRNLVDQFLGELRTRGYGDRESPPLLDDDDSDHRPRPVGAVTVETYQ
jgi:ribonuclease E